MKLFNSFPVHRTQILQRTATIDSKLEVCVLGEKETIISAGSHIKVKRWKGCYSHHGISDGNGNVIHFRWNPEKKTGVVTINEISVFSNGNSVTVLPTCKPLSALSRAYSKIGETGYNLMTNNCEHFAEWCKTGNRKSIQTRKAILTLSTIMAFILIQNISFIS